MSIVNCIIHAHIQDRYYDISGKLVKNLVNESKGSGVYNSMWDGRDDMGRKVGQGVYFYVLKTAGEKMQKKMLMLR